MFAWEVPSPFYMIPDYGILSPGAECTIKVVFQAKVAAVYDVTATCWFGGENKQKRTIQIKALGESSLHLVLKEMCVIPNCGTAFCRDTWRCCTLRLCRSWLNVLMSK